MRTLLLHVVIYYARIQVIMIELILLRFVPTLGFKHPLSLFVHALITLTHASILTVFGIVPYRLSRSHGGDYCLYASAWFVFRREEFLFWSKKCLEKERK